MTFDISYLSPELILAIGAMLVLIVGFGLRKWAVPGRVGLLSPESVSLAVLLAALIPSIIYLRIDSIAQGISLGGVMAVDGFALFFKIIAIIASMIVVFLSVEHFRRVKLHRAEYYALLVFATLAVTALSAATDLIMIYLALEFLSITSYVLAGYQKQDPRSNEAAVKYFLYGSIAAAVMIYGMSLLYGLTGTTNIMQIASRLRTAGEGMGGNPTFWIQHSAVLYMSLVMVLVGFGFKVAMVPFHQWSPDTYEGAPTPVTAFLSVGSKAAGLAILIRFLATGLPADTVSWTTLIVVLSALTMTVGNLVALAQTNMKRLLAYSSIAQAGYLLIGVAAIPYNSAAAIQAIQIYLFAYLFMNLGVFALVTALGTRLNSDDIRAYSGMFRRSPTIALAMVVFMLSLAGIPPTAGFLGKFYVFYAAIRSESTPLLWLAGVAIVNTVISVYYYFNVVRQMFFTESHDDSPIHLSAPISLVLGFTLAMTLLILLYPQPFITLATMSSRLLGM